MNCCVKGTCEASENGTTGKNCPRCGSTSKKVSLITVRYMVKGTFQSQIHNKDSYEFCLSSSCPVVYFSKNSDHIITKDWLNKRVTIKEKDDPIPICYCFNFFRHDVEKEIKETGKTMILDFISDQVKLGNCACEFTNPQGTCCLGNVGSIVKEILHKCS